MTFCYQCGKPIDQGTRFCPGCGASQSTDDPVSRQDPSSASQEPAYKPSESPYSQQDFSFSAPQSPYDQPEPQRPAYSDSSAPGSGSYYPGAMSPTKKKPSKFLMIGVPVIAVVAIAAAIFALIFFRTTPLLAVSRALSSVGEEVTTRLDSTPVKAVMMLVDTLKDGTLSVDFTYEDYYGDSVAGSVVLSSNSKERDYAIEADVSAYGDKFDLSVFMNKERLAVGSKLLDSNYYGVKYSTFRNDVRSFGDLTGLDEKTMDTLSDIVEMIGDMMNAEDVSKDYVKSYSDIMTRFFENCEVKSERDTVESGGSSARCTRVDIVITEDALFALLEDYLTLLEDDDTVDKYLGMFDNELINGAAGNVAGSYKDSIKEMRKLVREFERNYSGDITVSMFVGSRNRLLRAEIDADLRIDGDRTRIKGTFDFGASAQDRWTFNFNITAGDMRETFKVVWDYRERTNTIENTLAFTDSDGDTVTLQSSWAPDRGDFTLSFDDSRNVSEVSGVFRPGKDGFRLSFDNLLESSYSGDSLTIDINAQSGVQIKQVDYVKIDKWDEELLEKIVGLVSGGMLPGIGGSMQVPTPPPISTGSTLPSYGGDVFVPYYTEFEFTPDYTGEWILYTWDNGNSDPYLEVMDPWGSSVGYDDDGFDDYNSYLSVYLEAGLTYKIIAGFYGGDDGYMLSVWSY